METNEDIYFSEKDLEEFDESDTGLSPQKQFDSEIDENWRQASFEDLNRLRATKRYKDIKVPIDVEKKVYITLHLRDVTIDEELGLLEKFFTFDRKTGHATLNWKAYYQTFFERGIIKTTPQIRWKKFRFMDSKFFNLIQDYLPDPFTLESRAVGKISELEIKKSD